MSQQTAETLRKARGLIEQGWTRGSAARSRHGDGVYFASPSAVRFCPLGAIERVKESTDHAYAAVMAIRAVLPASTHIALWNDAPSRRKSDVLALFDRAIQAEEAKD